MSRLYLCVCWVFFFLIFVRLSLSLYCIRLIHDILSLHLWKTLTNFFLGFSRICVLLRLIPTYTKFILSFFLSLSLCLVTIANFKSVFLSVCAGFCRYEILYSSLSVYGGCFTNEILCLSLSIQCGNKCMTLSLFTVEVLITKFIFLSVWVCCGLETNFCVFRRI